MVIKTVISGVRSFCSTFFGTDGDKGTRRPFPTRPSDLKVKVDTVPSCVESLRGHRSYHSRLTSPLDLRG